MSEFKIVGYTCGTGNEDECIVFKCVTESGKEFSCRPRGIARVRREMYFNGESYIGKMLTVRFQELTQDGIPRFGVGIVRDYE